MCVLVLLVGSWANLKSNIARFMYLGLSSALARVTEIRAAIEEVFYLSNDLAQRECTQQSIT